MSRDIRDLAWDGVSRLELAEVTEARCDESGYLVDCDVLDRELRRTGEILQDVELWSGGSSQAGLFAPPEQGDHLGVAWVRGLRSRPMALSWALAARPKRAVEPGDVAVQDRAGGGLFLVGGSRQRVTDADGTTLIEISGGRITIRNAGTTLLAGLQELCQAVQTLTTVGPPSPHSVSPATAGVAAAARAKFEALLQ